MGAGRFIGMRSSLVGAAACAVLLVVGGVAPAQMSKRSAAELMDAVMWNREPIGGPFQLTDQSGKLRGERDFRGHLMLVYFGFTTCPDICPTDLQAISLAMDQLGADADDVQPLFITLDPERDTREHLADYVTMFHPRLLGLTGSAEAVERAADAYRVYYKRVDFDKGDGYYTVDHSAFIYLMDRDGKYLGFFPPGTPAEKMVEMIRPHLAGSLSR
jgi:cytochrome oxidase Cu insertion factor (SCO1/SenC/PrrC family)